MKKIVLKDDFAFVYLNKLFYTKELILDTINDYKDFFNASISEVGKYVVLKIEKKNDDYSLDVLAKEYLNLLLSKEYGVS